LARFPVPRVDLLQDRMEYYLEWEPSFERTLFGYLDCYLIEAESSWMKMIEFETAS
jgi:hypothetical protein